MNNSNITIANTVNPKMIIVNSVFYNSGEESVRKSFINAALIVNAREYEPSDTKSFKTAKSIIHLINGFKYFVQESPEEIVSLVNN